jgi:hypothetical protein
VAPGSSYGTKRVDIAPLNSSRVQLGAHIPPLHFIEEVFVAAAIIRPCGKSPTIIPSREKGGSYATPRI